MRIEVTQVHATYAAKVPVQAEVKAHHLENVLKANRSNGFLETLKDFLRRLTHAHQV